jgi:tyrosine-protein phosphatase SIW14
MPCPAHLLEQETMLNPAFRHALSARALVLAPVLLAVSAYAQQAPVGVGNFHMVNEHLCRGAQPTDEGFKNLAKMGVKTIVDLREADSRSLAEKKVVEAAGMKYVNIPLYGMQAPPAASVAKALAIFNDKQAGTVFVHCRRGADRTGTIVACYRVSHDGWDNTKALSEAKSFGMAWIERAMQHYVRDYRAPVQNASAADPAGTN